MAGRGLEGFKKYNFNADVRWREVEARLEIPPGKEAVLQHRKAKWYKANIDDSFNPDLVRGERTAAPPRATQPEPAPYQSRSGPSPTFASGGTMPRRTPPSGGAGRYGPQEIYMAIGNAAVIIFAVLAIPTVVLGMQSFLYSYCLLTSIMVNVYKIYLTFGMPQIWPLGRRSLEAIAQWYPAPSHTAEFGTMAMSAFFLNGSPLTSVMIPVVIPAVYNVAAFARRHLTNFSMWQRYGIRADAWLLSKREDALKLSAVSEIATGVLVIVGLLSPRRNLLLAFVYWRSILPLRYWSADGGRYHREVWSRLDSTTRAFRAKFPILEKGINVVKLCFQPPQPR